MANQYTATPIPDKKELEELYKTGFTQKEVGEHYGVSQKVIWTWFNKVGIKSRTPKKKNQRGENNDSWKGKDAGVAAFHYRLKKKKGKAKRCEVCGQGNYFEWANLSGNYGDLDDYKQMCKSCSGMSDILTSLISLVSGFS